MSRIVTIPSYMRPFTLSINNKSYVYPAGETMEVPDEVAAIIENYYALMAGPSANEAAEENGMVAKDPDSSVQFALGYDDGGLYCVTD